MTGTQTAIVSDYEQNGASPEQIAQDQDLDITAVKATLLQFSSKYRDTLQDKKSALVEKEDVTEDEYSEILAAYKNLALYSDNDFLRERALRNLINERKGRNDPKVKEQVVKSGGTINVFTLNEYIVEARAKALQNAIDVGAIEVKQISNG